MVVLTTRTQVKAEHTAAVGAAARRLFQAIGQSRLPNVRCFSS